MSDDSDDDEKTGGLQFGAENTEVEIPNIVEIGEEDVFQEENLVNSSQIQDGSDLMNDIMGSDSMGATSNGVMTMEDATRGLDLGNTTTEVQQTNTITTNDLGLSLSDEDDEDEEDESN